ncbi:MAG: hypothetical protein U0821_07520 [Chloroflexota bacterium]
MLPAALFVLMILWLIGALQIGNTDFLWGVIMRVGEHPVTVLDGLIAAVTILLIAGLPGPLALGASATTVLWAAATTGVVSIEGVPVGLLATLAIMTGTMVHLVTRKAGR